MSTNLPVILEIIAPAQRDGIPCVKTSEKITIRLIRKPDTGTSLRVNNGTVYIIDPFGKPVSKVPFRFGKTNFGQFTLAMKKQLLSGYYTVLVTFQEPTIKTQVGDKDSYKVIPENHEVLGCFYLDGGYPPIVIHRVNYRAAIKNIVHPNIDNVQVIIAVPPPLQPRQDILDFKCSPKSGIVQNDFIGNTWIKFTSARLKMREPFTCGYTALLRNKAVRYNLPVKTQNPAIPGHLEAFTQPENFIESHHHLIKDLAHDIAQFNKTPIQFARAAMRAIMKRMKYVRQEYERGAAYAIEKGVGDCTEYAALFTALCRANRIPARLEAGFADNGTGFERHAWSQIWIRGQWIPVDPTWHGAMGILGVTNRHVPLIIGNWLDTRIRQEFKVTWFSQKESVNGKKIEPQIETAWKVSRVVTIPEAPKPMLSLVPVGLTAQAPDAVPRGSILPVKVSLIPSATPSFSRNQLVMTATLSDGMMDQVVALEPFTSSSHSPLNKRLLLEMPKVTNKIILSLQLYVDQKPTSTIWRKTIGLI
ncbi:MAG: transglutaminase-like domain-containing protein [Candidatus Thorarchaeota archaeon]